MPISKKKKRKEKEKKKKTLLKDSVLFLFINLEKSNGINFSRSTFYKFEMISVGDSHFKVCFFFKNKEPKRLHGRSLDGVYRMRTRLYRLKTDTKSSSEITYQSEDGNFSKV